MGSIDIVHRQSPLFVLNEFVKKTWIGVESVDSLEIYILPWNLQSYIYLSKILDIGINDSSNKLFNYNI